MCLRMPPRWRGWVLQHSTAGGRAEKHRQGAGASLARVLCLSAYTPKCIVDYDKCRVWLDRRYFFGGVSCFICFCRVLSCVCCSVFQLMRFFCVGVVFCSSFPSFE